MRAILRAYMRREDITAYRGNAITDDVCGYAINQAGLREEATRYLNTLAPEGYPLGWHEGNLFPGSEEW